MKSSTVGICQFAFLSATFTFCACDVQAFSPSADDYCFSCEGNHPRHHLEPEANPPQINNIDFINFEMGVDPQPITGSNLVASGFSGSSIAGGVGPEYAVTISHTADLADYSANEFTGAGTTLPIWFGNEGGILKQLGFTPYNPPFAPAEEFVSGYGFLSRGGPNFKSVHIPSVFVSPFGLPEGTPIDMPIGDGVFQIWANGVGYGFNVNETFDFTLLDPAGVSSFVVTGFDPSEMLLTNTPLPFTYGVEFVSQGIVQSVVLPLVPVNNIPEPNALLLLAMGVLATIAGNSRN